MDLKAIADALAARYAAGTIATPSGALAMRSSHGQAPHATPQTPFVVVMPQTGTADYMKMTGMRYSEVDFDVLFYISKAAGDIAREETQRQLWLGTLLNATHPASKLGLGSSGVMKALPISWEFTELPYGGDSFDGIRITVRVWVEENVTLVAA